MLEIELFIYKNTRLGCKFTKKVHRYGGQNDLLGGQNIIKNTSHTIIHYFTHYFHPPVYPHPYKNWGYCHTDE